MAKGVLQLCCGGESFDSTHNIQGDHKYENAMKPLPGKKGVALSLRPEGEKGSWVENLPILIKLKPSWNYNWNLERIEQQPDDIEFVPMAWTGKFPGKLQKKIEELVLPHVHTGKVKRIFAFNEPDNTDQSDMTVQQAIAAWPVLAKANVPIVGPSTVNAFNAWSTEFDEKLVSTLQSHRDLDADNHDYRWIGVHWYGGANFNAFVAHLEKVKAAYPRQTKIIVTEFAPADWCCKSPECNKWKPQQVLAFAKKALPWMEETEWIAGYAWFPFPQDHAAGASSALFDREGKLTRLGRYYASVTPKNPSGNQSI